MPHITAMDRNTQAVLVTGAAKGIGEAVTERLSELGYLVFAGVRQDADIERYRSHKSGRVHPLRLEVTDEAAIRNAATEIKSVLGDRMLYGLVNNAGIALAGPLEFLPIKELRRQLEVNVIGQIAVTQAVLPLLRRSRGRIVNIGSIAGRSAMPMVGAYAASKHALEALTDALRVELMTAGIDVSIVEPGVIATPIWETAIKSGEAIIDELPPEAFEYYGRIMDKAKERAAGAGAAGLPASMVADVVVNALTARKPRTRYLVGRDARIRMLLQRLPDRWRDRLIARQLARL
jgi:NAD(P)-dependent dehydrogenase (short-subunit alcohol dehydrogenase family)